MAIMIPDTCPARATAGEKRTFALLRDLLPDNFTAWYEPVVQGRYPDFTLLADSFGLLVLEVKGWYPRQIGAASDQEVELHRTDDGQTRVERVQNPIRQVREYLFAVMDELRRGEYAILQQPDGAHRGKLAFPCGSGVLLTNITRPQLDQAGLSAVFPREKVLCRDELAALEGTGDREVLRRLKQLFPAPFPFDPLSEDQLGTVKGVLHREVVVKARPASAATVSGIGAVPAGALTLEVLDTFQEQAARAMGGGHHVVSGVAGSGKTVLLLARARLAAEASPTSKVLILCYNRALAAGLAARLADDPILERVEVRHFHSWAARKTGLRMRADEAFDDYEARLVAAMLRAEGLWSEADRYDAILIDEAHDFAPDWFRCALILLRGGAEGELLIAVDGAQSLYGRDRGFTWKGVGVQAQGRSRRLSRNYRNTRPILEFAWQVAQSVLPGTGDDETFPRILPTHATRPGPSPQYRACRSLAEERSVVARLVLEARAQGIAPEQIAVLYPRKERDRIDLLCRSLRAVINVCWISNESDPEGGVRSLARPGVRVSTIHAAKGLEFQAVILSALDQLPNPQQSDEVRDSNLFYVALTRAMERLAVTWVDRSAFTERVVRSTRVEPLLDE